MTSKLESKTGKFQRIRKSLFSLGLMTAMLASMVSPVSAATRTVNCSDATCLKNALSAAQPGDDIVLASGTYNGKFVGAASGSSSNKITLRSASASNRAVINGGGTGSGYALQVTGDYWVIKDLKVTNAQKGIMLDHSNYSLIDNAEVYSVGQEAVHFRDGSSNNVIQNSSIHDTGLTDPSYGEGVYVGSDNSKWSTYAKEADNNKVTNVSFGPNIAAEHVDIKEGTTGTIVENSTFNGTGISGENYADSFIDVKGNNAIIRNNTGNRNNNSIIVDAFQVHQQVSGWGLNAQFTGNTLNLDIAAPYIVNAASGTTATASGNIRVPSGNMYSGNVTVSGGTSDTQSPTVPANLQANAASSSQINLTWSASTDNVGVTGYEIYRNSSLLKTVTGTSASDTGLTASTAYQYYVKAYDAAGNKSASSSTVSATTLSSGGGGTVSTLTPTDDAYVRDGSGNESTNYGTQTSLYLKTDSVGANRIAYLKFDLSGVTSASSAKLRIYGSSSANTTVTAYQAADSWAQGSITWLNKPAAGSAAGSVAMNTTDQYYEIDVTSYVQSQVSGDHIVTFVLQESAGKYTTLASSESSTNKPQLVVTP